jgi:hypothetical protein
MAANEQLRAKTPMSDLEVAQRIAFALELGRQQLLRQKDEASVGDKD